MHKRSLVAVTTFAVLAVSASAQSFQRRAVMTGRGDPNRGKCTIEVVVDGAADIEIRGDNGVIRNLSGRPAEWRRFECNQVMPANPGNFRFRGIDGRGSQELVRDPSSGGRAVVRIQDRDGGAEGYTFDLEWSGGGGYPGGGYQGGGNQGGGYQGGGNQGGYGRDGDRDRDRDYNNRGRDRRWTTEEAVRGCQDAVSQQAAERYGARNVEFRRTILDDNPGRRDVVVGAFSVRRRMGEQVYRFSCSVNFDTGRIRSADIEAPRR